MENAIIIAMCIAAVLLAAIIILAVLLVRRSLAVKAVRQNLNYTDERFKEQRLQLEEVKEGFSSYSTEVPSDVSDYKAAQTFMMKITRDLMNDGVLVVEATKSNKKVTLYGRKVNKA